MEEPSDDTPSVTPVGRDSSLREGAGNGRYHSTGCSLNRGVAGDFHRPYGGLCHSSGGAEVLLYEAIVQDPDGGFEVFVVHAEDDVQFVGALVDHADIDSGFAQGGEDFAGDAGAEGHLPAYGGYHGNLVVDGEGVGLELLLDVRHDGIQALGNGLGGDHDGQVINSVGRTGKMVPSWSTWAPE